MSLTNLLVALTIVAPLFVASYRFDSNNTTISLKQFNIFNRLGKGTYGSVYLATKIGGSDDGQRYALKAINIPIALKCTKTDILKNEHEMFELVEELNLPFTTRLRYAFRKGKWAFLVMNFVAGGTLACRLNNTFPDAETATLILAEMVTQIEKLHNANISHGDLSLSNILIDENGHFVLTDFAFSHRYFENDVSKNDWNRLYFMCYQLFPAPKGNIHERSLMRLLNKMNDIKLTELKNYPYFSGIDWAMVDKGEFPPFEPIEIQLNLDSQLDRDEIETEFHGLNDELDPYTIDRLRSELNDIWVEFLVETIT